MGLMTLNPPETGSLPANGLENNIDNPIEQFERDGFMVWRGLFTQSEVDQIRGVFFEQAKDGPVEGLSEIRPYDPNDPLWRYPRMMNPHSHPELIVGPVALDFLLNSRLHALLTRIMGDEPLACQTMFYFKPPGARGQDLHQDNFYLRVKPGTCYAAWLAVDDADEENGGMVVVPGTESIDVACPEKSDLSRSFTDAYVAPPPGLFETPVRLKAGDCLFFNGSVIHGSYPNTSKDRFRSALIAHYVPESSVELSQWYKALRFDGSYVDVPAAVGGGPCGVVGEAKGPH